MAVWVLREREQRAHVIGDRAVLELPLFPQHLHVLLDPVAELHVAADARETWRHAVGVLEPAQQPLEDLHVVRGRALDDAASVAHAIERLQAVCGQRADTAHRYKSQRRQAQGRRWRLRTVDVGLKLGLHRCRHGREREVQNLLLVVRVLLEGGHVVQLSEEAGLQLLLLSDIVVEEQVHLLIGRVLLGLQLELPQPWELDGEAAQEGDAPLVTTLLGAKGGDVVHADQRDVADAPLRLERQPFREEPHQLGVLFRRHEGRNGGLLEGQWCRLERAPACGESGAGDVCKDWARVRKPTGSIGTLRHANAQGRRGLYRA